MSDLLEKKSQVIYRLRLFERHEHTAEKAVLYARNVFDRIQCLDQGWDTP